MYDEINRAVKVVLVLSCLALVLSVIAIGIAWSQDLKTIPEEPPRLFCMPLSHYEAIKQDMEELRGINYALIEGCK